MKKILSFLLVLIMTATAMLVVVQPMKVEAATTYEFLFPVNNGGVKIAYIYGKSAAYFDNTTFHYGIDIHSSTDQVIYAAFSGTVTKVNNACGHVNYGQNCGHDGGFGNSVYIKSNNGQLYGVYGHLKQHSILVNVGDYVEQGQPIASMGSAGWSTGKHLHFEVRTNPASQSYAININPTNASSNKGVVNYITTGYKPMQSDTIAEGIYQFNNDGYRMYMKKDTSNFDTLGASNSSVTSKFEFKVVKDGNYYRVVPKDGGKNYLNSVWTDSHDNHSLNGAEVTLCSNDASDYSQKWIFEKCGDGYLIHPACTPAFSITREDSKLVVKATTKDANQIWKLEGNCNHSYQYKSNNAEHWQECTLCGDKQSTSPHAYTNNCDTSCDTCGNTRVPEHSYKYTASDEKWCWQECTICGDTTEKHVHRINTTFQYTETHCWLVCWDCGYLVGYAPHRYSNNCDNTCNSCAYTRTIEHTYGSTYSYNTTTHWKTCTICNTTSTSTAHVYTNNCDASCNTCGYARSITHSYDSAYTYNSDTHWKTCSICGHKGTTTSHSYSNNCDSSCNTCTYIRTTEHVYDNDCDTKCNTVGCGYTRTIEHTYDNACDTACNVCNEFRLVTHTFDNDCDTTCNKCDFTRAPQHQYDSLYDKECNICGETRTIETTPAETTPEEPSPNAPQSGSADLDQKTITTIAIAAAVTVSAISIFGTALVMRRKR